MQFVKKELDPLMKLARPYYARHFAFSDEAADEIISAAFEDIDVKSSDFKDHRRKIFKWQNEWQRVILRDLKAFVSVHSNVQSLFTMC